MIVPRKVHLASPTEELLSTGRPAVSTVTEVVCWIKFCTAARPGDIMLAGWIGANSQVSKDAAGWISRGGGLVASERPTFRPSSYCPAGRLVTGKAADGRGRMGGHGVALCDDSEDESRGTFASRLTPLQSMVWAKSAFVVLNLVTVTAGTIPVRMKVNCFSREIAEGIEHDRHLVRFHRHLRFPFHRHGPLPFPSCGIADRLMHATK